MKHPFPANLVIVVAAASCCGPDNNKEIKVASYLSYNAATLPASVPIDSSTDYDNLVLGAFDLVGLPGSDIEIQKVSTFGAFSVINKISNRRFFLYCPDFFDSVKASTNSLNAIRSVCFHEFAHQFYRHPLKSSWGSHTYEKQADRYSGFQMCLIGATLEESLAAMEHFGDTQDTPTHPGKNTRLAEIEAGYIEAKVKVFKDTAFIKRFMQRHTAEMLFAVANSFDQGLEGIETLGFHSDTTFALNESFMESTDILEKTATHYTENLINEKNNKRIKVREWLKSELKSISDPTYNLMGELISVTPDKKVKRLTTNEIVGKLIETGNEHSNKILDLDGVRFYINPDGVIFSVNPDGSQIEVGNRLR